jgi:multiple sugar transport system substrate-binding protein
MQSFQNAAICMAILALSLTVGACEKRGEGAATASKAQPAFAFEGTPTSTVTFLSTQFNPVEEAGKMRDVILKDFPAKVDFRPNDNSLVFSQIEAMLKANSAGSLLIGAAHGDLISLYDKGSLQVVDSVYAGLKGREFSPALVSLSRLDGKDMYYIPWTQASFVMVANKKALAYLPKGAVLDSLTYDQLLQWAKNIRDKTGNKALGFPAGKNGLMHRFFQGYLYPSYTASTLLKFRAPEAKGMWTFFKELWAYANPGSLAYSTMAEPLLTGEVWLAWDHVARLIKAFQDKPKDFVAFPAPVGPKGRGFMAIIAGVGIPKGEADYKNAAMLIDYLTQPAIQARTMDATGFLPVVNLGKGNAPPAHLESLKSAVDRQTNDPASILTLSPLGLGEQGGSYNSVFMLTFSEIVLDDKDIGTVLSSNAAELQRLIDKANAKSWLPDAPGPRPCKIE